MTHRSPLRRGFGRAVCDLELDFDAGDRPALVTTLLAACAEPADAAHWWRRPVGERTAILLGLLRDTEGGESLPITLRCDVPACGERFEVDVPYQALEIASPQVETIELTRDDGGVLTLRRPTGEDLRMLQEMRPASREQALSAMVERLVVDGVPRLDDEGRVTDALSDADPLVAFSLVCACPACGYEAERDVDLEGLALRRLASRQRVLLREVHALASRYGWTEAEILAVPPARRARYLELIERVV